MANLKSDLHKDQFMVFEMDCFDLTEMILLSKPFKQHGKMILLHHHEELETPARRDLAVSI